jgi:hypothetical protein
MFRTGLPKASNLKTNARTISVPVIWYRPFQSTQDTYSDVGRRKRLRAGCEEGGWPGADIEFEGSDTAVTNAPSTSDEFVESHLDGAVAKKNFNLSRWAIRSCSW